MKKISIAIVFVFIFVIGCGVDQHMDEGRESKIHDKMRQMAISKPQKLKIIADTIKKSVYYGFSEPDTVKYKNSEINESNKKLFAHLASDFYYSATAINNTSENTIFTEQFETVNPFSSYIAASLLPSDHPEKWLNQNWMLTPLPLERNPKIFFGPVAINFNNFIQIDENTEDLSIINYLYGTSSTPPVKSGHVLIKKGTYPPPKSNGFLDPFKTVLGNNKTIVESHIVQKYELEQIDNNAKITITFKNINDKPLGVNSNLQDGNNELIQLVELDGTSATTTIETTIPNYFLTENRRVIIVGSFLSNTKEFKDKFGFTNDYIGWKWLRFKWGE